MNNLIQVRIKHPDDFLVVKETLERIGIANTTTKTLTQTAHILHKRGNLYIVHFKQMFELDGKNADISEEDLIRRDTIVHLLAEWGLVDIVDNTSLRSKQPRMVYILPHNQRRQWKLVSKYQVGRK